MGDIEIRKIYIWYIPEKAYDMVPRELMWLDIEKKQIPYQYTEVIEDMYNGILRSMTTIGEETSNFQLR